MTHKRNLLWAAAGFVAYEALLLLLAFGGYGTQQNPEQDEPIAFNVILVFLLIAGNVVGLLGALLAYALTSRRKHSRV